ncbi:MAG: hypothetical protein WBM32_08690 [Crocosphaera sp.]
MANIKDDSVKIFVLHLKYETKINPGIIDSCRKAKGAMMAIE